MLRKYFVLAAAAVGIGTTMSAQAPRRIAIGDWPELRGPARDGSSRETRLTDTRVLNGDNFLWRVPYGGIRAPIVMGNRVYAQVPSGRGPNLQEHDNALGAEFSRV